ncbi:MAG TPA: homoserine O-succinyltransferase [Steroidobacteraceae bacterium]|nr:homoserine O-succinyltransferase [Steroidobacteraceae bacterium]
MSATAEVLTATAAARAAVHPLIPVREGMLESGPLALRHHGHLEQVRIAWRLTGPAQAPVVCALGGISAHRHVCLTAEAACGWWHRIAGPGLPLDAAHFRILSFDYLGGSGESTGPAAGQGFPSISTDDQAQVLLRLLDHLGVASLHAIAGGSYGGMVALAFAAAHPERVERLLVIGAADRAHPMATAWRSTQRSIVRFGIDSGEPARAMQLARALAMTTYRSAEEFAARFDSPPGEAGGRFVFPVEEYLLSRGEDYAARYSPESFLCLSESIDLHRVNAARIFVPTTVVGFREDALVPLADLRAMVARLPRGRLHELSSIFGHDAFLTEPDLLRSIFAGTLGRDL